MTASAPETTATDQEAEEERRGALWGVAPDGVGQRRSDRQSLVWRFLAVVCAGYAAAILVVGIGVWLSAQPFLDQMRREASLEKAEAGARKVETMLRDVETELHDALSAPAVLRLVLGHERAPFQAAGQLSVLDTKSYVRFALLDYKGTPILRSTGFALRDRHALYHPSELFSASRALDPTRPDRSVIRLRNADNGSVHALIVIPIAVGGHLEGSFVIERPMVFPDLALASLGPDAVSGEWRLLTDFQVEQMPHWMGLETQPVASAIGDTGLNFVLVGFEDTVGLLGWDLVRSILRVAVWGLALPFLLMATFGRGVIAKPFEALAASRARLAESKKEVAELAQIATMSNDAIAVTDSAQRIIWVNPAFRRLTGYPERELLGRKPGALLQGRGTDRAVTARIGAAIRAGQPIREELLNYRKDGTAYWSQLSISPLCGDHGVIDRFVAISSDITDKKLAEERLESARRETEHQALHDALTGLPNRRALDLLLEREIGPAPEPRTLVRIDLDHFKTVNDTHGHAAGDAVLVHIGDILRDHIGPDDFAGRIGGDEFVVALGAGQRRKDGERLADVLLREIRKDIRVGGKTCRVGASFGVASGDDGLLRNDELLVAADAALYEAKETGRSQTVVYAPAIHAELQEMRKLAQEIEDGILREEFVPLFQPQIDAVTQEIVGAEVLLRWQHPDRGLLVPGHFLATAARLSMLTEIDRIIYRQGLRAAAELERVGSPLPKISFNVGSAQIEDPELITISDLCPLRETTVAFEILESVLIEEQSSNFRFQVDRLRERGYRIEIDDFGSGHASVVGLMQLSPDAMKIDQRLIIPITKSEKTRELVRHIVGIGRSFGISVTAEGVETAEHVRILRDLDCNTLQGFHYAHPLNVVELLDFIEGHNAERTAEAVSRVEAPAGSGAAEQHAAQAGISRL